MKVVSRLSGLGPLMQLEAEVVLALCSGGSVQWRGLNPVVRCYCTVDRDIGSRLLPICLARPE